ncbi:MAG: ABC transporter permease [Defluviitaleaceae bacterium]|nr:ABC transporter permease [Defluviitaleaceae bacterium]
MLIKRNIKLYFRDKMNVFFSLMAVFIMIALYVLFLGSVMESALLNIIGMEIDAGPIMTSIVMAGMIATTSVTSGLAGIYRFIADKERAAKDFFTTPISRRKILFSYVISAAVISVIMSTAALFVSLVYLAIRGNNLITPLNIVMLFVAIILTALCANSMVFFLSSLAKTREAFSSLNIILGTLIGFFMGVYIPIGNLPSGVQWALRLFPLNHGASMFRQILTEDMLTNLFAHPNAPDEYLEHFRLFFGVTFQYRNFTSSFWFSAAVLAITAVIFYALSLAVVAKRRLY